MQRLISVASMAACIAVLHVPATVQAEELEFTGVNLSGAEFGMGVLPGTYGTNYTYPTNAEVDYYTSKGMNTFRLPFRWERMQPTPGGTLNAAELSRMDAFVNYATSKGDNVLIDPHNFERYYPTASNFQSSNQGLIGGSTKDTQSSYNMLNGGNGHGNGVGDVVVTNAMFDSLWSQLAAHYASNSHVIFDLMNEPNNVTASQVVTTDNTAIAAIRSAGAQNLVLVEGTSYTGAWTWTSSGNAAAMLNIVDPDNNYAFELHQYMDSDGSGTHATINNNDPMTGVERLTDVTQWLEQNHLRGFLGEFAVDNSIINKNNPADPNTLGNEVLNNMLQYMQANSSAWMGWTFWGGGPWWATNSLFHIDPVNGVDQNVMPVLQQYLPKAGDFNHDGSVTVADVQAMLSMLSDLNTWKANEAALGLNSTQEQLIADVNGDGTINNLDLQALISQLANSGGGSSLAAVPEPPSFLLLVLAIPALIAASQKRRCSIC